MEKVGLIAGGGLLPLEFIRSARSEGQKVVVFAIRGQASPLLEKESDKLYQMDVGEYKKFAFLLVKERIRRLALVGKVPKNIIYKNESYDKEGKEYLEKLRDKKDYSILEEITKHLGKIGVEVISGMEYLAHLLPKKGVLTATVPDERMKTDIALGYDTAGKLAGMDIGQTVVVKNGTIVAVEAMEGTDATITRAHEIAGDGCVMVKVSRPDQDMRWDVPTVGPETIAGLVRNKFSALAIENGRMFFVDKDRSVKAADAAGLIIEVL
ncbi:MAG: UDP-2,3-diacylglucosamine diphosphatase LpxI [Candidatus Omnitrophota bacterium]